MFSISLKLYSSLEPIEPVGSWQGGKGESGVEQGISLLDESFLSVYVNYISHILKEYFLDLSSCISQLSG